MNKKTIYSGLVILIALGVYVYETYNRQDPAKETTPSHETIPETEENQTSNTNPYFLPTSTTGYIIHHNYYSLSYSEAYEQAEWVAYELKKEHLSQAERKRPYFNEDPLVQTGSADWRNYKNSGYDRGHLCPAGDRRFSVFAYNQTFLTSNITPQKHDFNSGIWNRLEIQTRDWANTMDGVFVVTGGILEKDLERIGTEKVAVPKWFYKIILDFNGKKKTMIGFLIPHQESRQKLSAFVVTVDEIEKRTGIDFFPQLEDGLEERLESQSNEKDWF